MNIGICLASRGYACRIYAFHAATVDHLRNLRMQAARTQVLQLQAELEDLRASASAPPVATHVHRSNAEGNRLCLWQQLQFPG
eukprot:1153363-Pelagomonas_calceolata.AAC.3